MYFFSRNNKITDGGDSFDFGGGRTRDSLGPNGPDDFIGLPAGADPSSDLPHPTTAVPPAAPPPNGRGSRNEKRKGRAGSKAAAVIAVALALIVITSVGAFLAVNYELRLTQGDKGLIVAFVEKRRAGDQQSEGMPGNFNNSPPKINGSGPGGEKTDGVPAAPVGDGTTLNIGGTPQGGAPEQLTNQQIYAKCVKSVVAVEARYSGGTSEGTGIVMAGSGYVITNSHVIANSDAITVRLDDRSVHTAALVGLDEETDLAVLKIDAQNLTEAEFGNSAMAQVGDDVVTISNPFGLSMTMTKGIISGINRDIYVNGYKMTLLQTSALINSGSSGGPLINMYGQVIGITNIKMASSYTTVEGIGFAIPIATVKTVVDELIQNGYVSGRPSLGVTVKTLAAIASEYYGTPRGVVVQYVERGSSAYEQGVQVGDIITQVEGTDITSSDELIEIRNRYAVGDTISLTIYRNGETFAVGVKLMESAEFSSSDR